MDKWEWERVYRNKGGSAISPSFSSSLLDAIDRSIDDGDGARHPPAQIDPPARNHQEAYNNHKHPNVYFAHPHDEAALPHGGYAHRVAGNNNNQAFSLHLPQSKQRKGGDRDRGRRSSVCSVSSSSESSSAGGFSSSEAESVAALSVRTRKPPLAVAGLADRSARLSERDVPAAVKAEAAARKAKLLLQHHQAANLESQQHHHQQQQHKDGAGTIKGRIRASRIYGELKKARSPVSPGGRLAAFLNTLFTNTHTRGGGAKSKSACTSPRESALRHQHHHQQPCPLPLPANPPRLVIPPRPVPARDTSATTAGPAEDDSLCSSASSYSRSCLSKTPSTHGATKRSVRFCPVNVIVEDNYSRRFFQDKKPAFDAAAVHPYAPPAAGPKHLATLPPVEVDGDVEFYDDEDDDDGTASCSSSDLFELENLAGVGASRYADELPVYETTHLRTNRAIAQGLVV